MKLLAGICQRRGRHWMTSLRQDAPWLDAGENFIRSLKYGSRRYWHSHCRLCGAQRTVAIDERQPGAKESKRLLLPGVVEVERSGGHFYIDGKLIRNLGEAYMHEADEIVGEHLRQRSTPHLPAPMPSTPPGDES